MAVYDSFYGLRASPFTISPDPAFLFLSRTHREALAGLIYAICERKGFALLAGEVGTGKTTLVHSILSQLGDRVRSAFIYNPHLAREELYQELLSDFGLPATPTVRTAVHALQRYLLEQFRAGRPVVLILDEAHVLSDETIEELRVLSNFETPSAKLLQIVLVGQPELLERVNTHRLRALRQRITVRLELRPLSLEESIAYVRTRLERAGRRGELFTPRAQVALYEYTRGLPRALNTLADNALLVGLARNQASVDAPLVHAAADNLGVKRIVRVNLFRRLRRRAVTDSEDTEMATMNEFIEQLLEPVR